MNPQIGLRIDADVVESIPSGALVNVRAFDERGRGQLLHTLPVPVSGQAAFQTTISVVPGVYEISALLPSGSTLSRIVTVPSTSEIVDATLKAPATDYLWAGPEGTVLPQRPDLSAKAMPGWKWVWSLPVFRAFPSMAKVPALQMFSVPTSEAPATDPVWSWLSQHLASLQPDTVLNPAHVIPPLARTIEMRKREKDGVVTIEPTEGAYRPGRNYLLTLRDRESFLSVLPWPWQQIMNGGDASVRVVISENEAKSPDEQAGAHWCVRTSVRDQLLAGVFEYFLSGEHSAARSLVEPAREMLYYKVQNPISAAAGAYVLVSHWINESSKGITSSNLDWMTWVGNLYHRFPWLPDGAILHGWLTLRMRGRDRKLDEARTALLAAERRGIPFFVPGVRRLVDGLMLLAGDAKRRKQPDPEVDAALGRVRRLAWQVDPAQPFTTVRLWSD